MGKILMAIAIGLVLFGLGLVFFPWNSLNGMEILGFRLQIGEYSNLGSFVGGITSPVLSLAAFILLFLTYQSQKEELQATRNLIKKQQFESTFFNLLEAQNNSLKNLSIWIDEEKLSIHGNGIFQHFHDELAKALNFERKSSEDLEDYEKVYDEIYYKYNSQFEFLLTSLTTLSRFIEREKLTDIDSKFYYSVVASQLTDTERALIQYHIKLYTFRGKEDCLKLIKRVLWRTGTISLSNFHDFILDADIHSSSPEDDRKR